MKKLATVLLCVVLFAPALPLYAQYIKQFNVTSALNQTKYESDGTVGAALPLINTAQDASTDCEGDAFTDTASLTCAHTGEIVVSGWGQATVEIMHSNNSGSEVQMECETQKSYSGVWAAVDKVSGNTVTTRQWNKSCSADCTINANFNINADLLRCRAWVTSGAASDTVKFNVRLGVQGGA